MLADNAGVGRTGGDGGHRRGRGGPACLQPHLHVGEAVFEGLVGRQRPAEGVPVQRPRDGEVEHRLQNADDFGALQHLRDLALTVDQRGGLGGAADGRAAVDVHAFEMHTGVLLDQSIDCCGSIAHPGASVGTRNWRTPSSARATTSSRPLCAPASTRSLTPSMR